MLGPAPARARAVGRAGVWLLTREGGAALLCARLACSMAVSIFGAGLSSSAAPAAAAAEAAEERQVSLSLTVAAR